ncbi:hypothetical protein FQR65_LT20030 [Abscondita terminalis]|nr:hypothetical protein FQR65_LT20030 [Abscondita terminalis]
MLPIAPTDGVAIGGLTRIRCRSPTLRSLRPHRLFLVVTARDTTTSYAFARVPIGEVETTASAPSPSPYWRSRHWLSAPSKFAAVMMLMTAADRARLAGSPSIHGSASAASLLERTSSSLDHRPTESFAVCRPRVDAQVPPGLSPALSGFERLSGDCRWRTMFCRMSPTAGSPSARCRCGRSSDRLRVSTSTLADMRRTGHFQCAVEASCVVAVLLERRACRARSGGGGQQAHPHGDCGNSSRSLSRKKAKSYRCVNTAVRYGRSRIDLYERQARVFADLSGAPRSLLLHAIIDIHHRSRIERVPQNQDRATWQIVGAPHTAGLCARRELAHHEEIAGPHSVD